MKKFALTAVALAMISGSAMAATSHTNWEGATDKFTGTITNKDQFEDVIKYTDVKTQATLRKAFADGKLTAEEIKASGISDHHFYTGLLSSAKTQSEYDKYLKQMNGGQNVDDNFVSNRDLKAHGSMIMNQVDTKVQYVVSQQAKVDAKQDERMDKVVSGLQDLGNFITNGGSIGPGTGDAETPTLPEFDNDGTIDRPQPGNGQGSVERPQPGAGEGSIERPLPGQGTRPEPHPGFGNGEGQVGGEDDSFGQPAPGEGSPERPQPGNGQGSVERPQPGEGEGSVSRPQPGAGEGSVERPRPGNGEGAIERPMPGENNRPGAGTGSEKPFPGQGERPYPGTGEGSVERPQPGNGVGSVERPRPGNGEGSVGRPQPGENNRPGAGTGTNKPFPGNGSAVERPQPPAFIGQINQNKDNIAAMGDAFEQRVDKVNGWLNQAGEAIKNNSAAIQNNSDRITNLESAFEQQAAHTNREIARLDDRIDGIGAMSQAVTAARPQLFGNQTSAIGMGIGHMGDATALAAGYVHRINENWSANANISTTFGTDDRDTSVGAGVAYAW